VLVAQQKLLDRTSETELDVTFESLEDGVYGIVVLSREEWEEMGEPEQITVMIMGGDQLSADPDLERSKRERGK
jgi:hypothetical protein